LGNHDVRLYAVHGHDEQRDDELRDERRPLDQTGHMPGTGVQADGKLLENEPPKQAHVRIHPQQTPAVHTSERKIRRALVQYAARYRRNIICVRFVSNYENSV